MLKSDLFFSLSLLSKPEMHAQVLFDIHVTHTLDSKAKASLSGVSDP